MDTVARYSAASRKAWRTRKRMAMARIGGLLPDGQEMGPAMLALTRRQRAFVLAYVAHPQASGTELAKLAGYKQSEGSRVWAGTASKMLRMPAIIAAIHEVISKTYRGRGAAIAQDVMLKIAQDRKHPKQLAAALALADRGGFGAMMESKLTVEHRDLTSDAMIRRIQRLVRQLGPIEAGRILGGRVIDVEPDQGRAVAGPEGDRAGDGAGGGPDTG